MNRRIVVAVVFLLAALAAAWWALRGEGVAPGSASALASNAPAQTAEDTAPAAAPRAARSGATSTDDPESSAPTVHGRVFFESDDDDSPASPPDLRSVVVVVYLRNDPLPGDFVIAPPTKVVASARTDESGVFEIPLPPSPDGRSFLVTARGVDEPFGADWREVPATGGSVTIRVVRRYYSGTIAVHRLDDDSPIAGATVRVGLFTTSDDEGTFVPRVTGRTDESGRSSVAPHAYEDVFVSAAGFKTVRVPAGGDRDEPVKLAPGEVVAGSVSWTDGTPVVGARIIPSGLGPVAWHTDETGRFRIEGAGRESPVPFEITADDARPWEGLLNPGATDLRIVLARRSMAIRGVVLLPDGTPAAGAAVEGRGWYAEARTDRNGRFVLRVPERDPISSLGDKEAQGRCVVTAYWHGDATSPACHGSAVAVEGPDADTNSVEIRLAPPERSWVVVRVRDELGRHAPWVRVSVGGSNQSEDRDDGAQCHLLDAAPGTLTAVRVTGERPGELLAPTFARSVPTTADNAGEPLDITVPALSRFRVTLDGGDTPIRMIVRHAPSADAEPGVASISLMRGDGYDDDRRMPDPVEVTAHSCTWEIDTSRPGLNVTAECVGLARVTHPVTAAELEAGECVIRMSPGYVVTGRLPGVGGDAEFDGSVYLVERPPGRAYMVPTREGPGQAFRFERVGAGTWDLVHQTRERAHSVPRTFEVAADVSLGAIDLPPTMHVRCAVRFADGRPAGGARVMLRTQHALGGDEPNVAFGITHSDGTIELPALVGAEGTLTATKAGFGAVVVGVHVGEGRVAPPLVLLPEGRVEVRVRAPRDVDPACEIGFETSDRLRSAFGRPLADDEVWTTRPDERFDHVAVYRGLAPGRVVVVAAGRGWRLEAPVTVVAGETAVVTLGDE